MDDEQLALYADCEADLPSVYRDVGFEVAHVPTRDHFPMSKEQLDEIWDAYQRLPKPVVVHCSAGVTRTGTALVYIIDQLSK